MRTLLTILLAAICVVGYAQKKPKINQALSALEEGNLSEAKSIIDEAIVHEKTKDDPKTWFYRGQIYAALDTANNEAGALEESLRSFDKTLELDPEQKAVNSVDFATGSIVNVDSKKQGIYAFYYGRAIQNYQDENFVAAADDFETAYYIMPIDTNAMLNAAYSSVAAEDDERAKRNFNKAYEAGVKDMNVFLQLYNYAVKEEDYEEGLNVLGKARAIYPNDINLMKYEINLYIQLKRTDEALDGLKTAIESDQQNADLWFSMGVLKEETGDLEGATESYKKALEIDPNHFNSNFNMGVSVFNEANALMKDRNNLGYKETKKYDQMTKQIDVKLKEALPIWERLYSINSTDRTVLETLGYIYDNLKMYEKANKIEDELNALEGN